MGGLDIVGRDEERSAIGWFLDTVETGPAALLLAGEAGIGKTILWEAGVGAAAARCPRVLICRGVEAEASWSFAGLSELLTPVLADTLASLPAPRRGALEVALSLAEPGAEVPDAHVIGLAVHDVFDVFVARGPLVVAVDDLQWVDVASAGALNVALRRLRDQRIGLLATVRETPEGAMPVDLTRGYPEGWLRRVTIGPLSVGAHHHLLRDRLGLDLSRPALLQLHEATGGNPLFALEVGTRARRLGARLEPGGPLPVPNDLGQLLEVRLSRLSTGTRNVLLIAALGGRVQIETVVAVHRDRRQALEALDEGAHEGVIEHVDGRVRFTHPLFAAVLRDGRVSGKAA